METNEQIRSYLAEILINPDAEVLDSISIDFTGVDKQLAPFLVKLAVEQPEKIPSASKFTVEVWGDDGQTDTLKLTANQLKDVWGIYSEKAVKSVSAEPSEQQPEKAPGEEDEQGRVAIRFVKRYKVYVPGDVTRRSKEAAKELVDNGKAEFA